MKGPKGPFKIIINGPPGSGKTQLLHLIEIILKTFGYDFIISEDEHTLEIIKKD
jgi:ABC-type lipoprotein export system ATPase subunit